MAKKKDESALEAETKMSLGNQMKTKMSQRDRNLVVKAELIKQGKHPKSEYGPNLTNREKNLLLKAKLKEDGKQGKKGRTKESSGE